MHIILYIFHYLPHLFQHDIARALEAYEWGDHLTHAGHESKVGELEEC